MIFTVYGKPQGKGRPRFTRTGHAYTPDSTREYEDAVRLAYIAAEGRKIPAGVPVTVNITAWYAIPKNARGALRERMASGQVAPTVKPDWDNVGKIVCDALNGIAWHDDAQITQATVHKVYGVTPMVRVEIVDTLEGTMTAQVGDYIIKGVNGEIYPCNPDIFAKTYDPVESEADHE